MLTEIWFKTNEKAVRLPVVPAEFERVISAEYETDILIGLGNVARFTANGLAQLSLSSFFPNHEYSFNAYSNVPKPYDIAHIFKEWKNKGTAVRVILTGTDINQDMYITNFSYGERDGTGDVYYTMDLTECRKISLPRFSNVIYSDNPENSKREDTTEEKEENAQTQKIHKVVKGDSLWAIAQKYYGKGSEYPKIKEANKTKYTSLSKNNVIFVGWELVIV